MIWKSIDEVTVSPSTLALTDTNGAVVAEYAGRPFSVFKPALADLAVAHLAPNTGRMQELMADPDAPAEAGLTAAHAKAHTSEIGRFIARTATEVHGGMGITDLLGLHYWFKRIGLNRQLLGGPERVRRIAARMQGLSA